MRSKNRLVENITIEAEGTGKRKKKKEKKIKITIQQGEWRECGGRQGSGKGRRTERVDGRRRAWGKGYERRGGGGAE